MGLGFGFGFGPFRAGGSFRGPGATDEEWASLVVVVLWITVPVFIFQVVLEFLTDPYFWFVMLVGCLPSVTLLLAHFATLDRVSIGGWWEKRDGSFVLLALPAAGYEILFFVWDDDGFGLRVDREGFQLRATALYALILFGYLVGEFLWMYFTVRFVGNSARRRRFNRPSEETERAAQLGREAFAQIKRQADQAESDITAGMSVVPVSQRPKAPCSNCGRYVIAGAKKCDGCSHSEFQWNCNGCGGVFVETRIGLLYCVRCGGFWR